MPSLFSRSRTTSTPQKKLNFDNNDSPTADEFGQGRSQSRASGGLGIGSPLSSSKKDKKRAKEAAKRAKAVGEQGDGDGEGPALPDGSFLPLNLEGPRSVGGREVTEYGYLAYERHVVLGLEEVEMLVRVVAEELETRGGITTPFIFSTTALDISGAGIKRLVRAFLGSLASVDGSRAWREEAKFAGPHELGMCLRWGLGRVVRIAGGQDVRGLVSWDMYSGFRDSEAAHGYPANHFEVFLDQLQPTLQAIVFRLLSLLTRLTANSTSSGHTPPTLSPLFGPLLFGLGPATLSFHHTYIHYLRAVNATEHILLAFIRSQGLSSALGVPIRLKEWIKGYPAMLPFLHEPKNVKPKPRKGAKTLTLTSVRRNVRMYSPDLVKSAATWAHRAKSSNGVVNGLANSKEWERIAPASLKLPPRYSENYKKRMNMPPNFHPDTAPGTILSSRSSATPNPTLASTLTIGTIAQSTDYLGLGRREGEDRFRSLTDLKWGEFESMGFGSISDDKKLQFDLTQSAREERVAKRQTMSWNDFSTTGFTRTDAPLNTTLQFSAPLALSVTNWPTKESELSKKIKKQEKQLPPFGWDTEPVMGSEEIVEEAFVDVFCDLIYGGGWMDLERGEVLDRDVNWALVEFKSLPPVRAPTTSSDPRTSATIILFEEFVPLEYRQQLLIKSTTRRRLPALFSPSKPKQWKQAPTLNGRPYVVGHVPRSPSYREMEFEGLLQGSGGTKVISLGNKGGMSGGRAVSTISTATTAMTGTTTVHGHGKDVPPLPPQALATITALSPPALSIPSASAPTPLQSRLVTMGGRPSTPRQQKSADEFIGSSTTTSESITPSKLLRPTTSSGSGSGGASGGGEKGPTSRFKITNVIPVPSPKRMSQLMTMTPTQHHPPMEYSAVDFETRLAGSGWSDSEGRNSNGDDTSHGRQRDDENAWVDILVNSQSRRLDGQDAEPGVGFSKNHATGSGEKKNNGPPIIGGVDPDLASLEVAQVLAAVRSHRNRSSSDLGSISTRDEIRGPPAEEVGREHGPSVDMDAHVQGLEIDEIERVPRLPPGGTATSSVGGMLGMDRGRGLSESESSTGHGQGFRLAYDDDDDDDADGDDEGDDDDEDEGDAEPSQDLSHIHGAQEELEPEQGSEAVPVRHALRQQRRMGYFDLHPERKQLHSSPSPSGRYSPPLPPPPQQQHELSVPYAHAPAATPTTVPQQQSPSPSWDSSFRVGAEMVETSGVSLLPSLGSTTKRERENGYTNGNAVSSTTTPVSIPIVPPVTPPIAHPIGPRAPAGSSSAGVGGAGTKTAALIEMYRERERKATGSASPPAAMAATTTNTTTTTSAAAAAAATPTLSIPSTPPHVQQQPSSIPVAISSVSPLRVPTRTASLPGATNPNIPLASGSILSSSPSFMQQQQQRGAPESSTPVQVMVDVDTPSTPTPLSKSPDPKSMLNLEDDDDDDEGSGEGEGEEITLQPAPGTTTTTTFVGELEETGRAGTPLRYVHGAPLHNVLEEEEEE